jgi:DNA processing protein
MGAREDYVRASLALSMIPSVGSGRTRRLLDHFKEPLSVFTADWSELSAIASIGAAVARSVRDFSAWEDVDRVLAMTKRHGLDLLTPQDKFYPKRLLHIYDPPVVLWVKGNSEALDREFIAVVGTRRPSGYGMETTIRLTRQLVRKVCAGIVSGLAHGVDTLAHTEALRNNSCTVAVLACGLDRVYPTGNRSLAFEIMKSGGAIISEYPPGTKPEAHHFPVRNRIVSGMSVGVLVTETGVTGGSMITAGAALDQGREVFAVPHGLRSDRGEGCNRIIQRGWGKLVCTVDDIISELPAGLKKQVADGNRVNERNASQSSITKRMRNTTSDPAEMGLLKLLSQKEMHIDDILRVSGVPVHLLMSILLKLELEGLISQRPGKIFAVSEW